MKEKRRNDLLLVGGILFLALLILLVSRAGKGAGREVRVEADGELLGIYPLSADTELRFEAADGGYNILRIEDGRAEVIDADCRDLICVSHDPVSREGETIICLPHKFVVTVTGGEE